jgi:hypothetical protein
VPIKTIAAIDCCLAINAPASQSEQYLYLKAIIARINGTIAETIDFVEVGLKFIGVIIITVI